LRSERERLDKRVGLMRPDSIDPDMLDELARANLGFAKPGDLVITTAN
jgi:cell division protein FtsB